MVQAETRAKCPLAEDWLQQDNAMEKARHLYKLTKMPMESGHMKRTKLQGVYGLTQLIFKKCPVQGVYEEVCVVRINMIYFSIIFIS